jgi:hypothetical protein
MRSILVISSSLILASSAIAADCESIPGADTLFRPGVVVLLGELHGTNESPAAVAKLACGAIAKSLNVTVGLELLVDDQERIDRYMRSSGTDADCDSLIAGYFWQRDYQDGRASQAMVGLIESLRRLGADTGQSVTVVALDNPAAPEGRDRFMAERLRSVFADDSTGFVIALTGNVHNRVTIGTHFDPEYEPMGYHLWLRSPEREVIALEITHEGGTAWISTSDTGYGVAQLEGPEGEPGIELYDDAANEPYQGRLHVGEISASLPAKDR